jgi:hypothetical protein
MSHVQFSGHSATLSHNKIALLSTFSPPHRLTVSDLHVLGQSFLGGTPEPSAPGSPATITACLGTPVSPTKLRKSKVQTPVSTRSFREQQSYRASAPQCYPATSAPQAGTGLLVFDQSRTMKCSDAFDWLKVSE